MSLTIAEARAVNVLVTWLDELGPTTTGREQIDAAAVLADAAHKRLGAGWTGPEFRARRLRPVARRDGGGR